MINQLHLASVSSLTEILSITSVSAFSVADARDLMGLQCVLLFNRPVHVTRRVTRRYFVSVRRPILLFRY